MSREIYQREFYTKRHEMTVSSAKSILSLILRILPPVSSAVDFGCGVGTWLAVLRDLGVQEVLGLEGNWVNQDLLQIDPIEFQTVDFTEDIQLKSRFDLGLSLEVAEHLPPQAAESFVKSLTDASDQVLFSAAIPDQGGTGHLNERWPDYWAGLFDRHDYRVLDVIRWQVWDDDSVLPWYRQNTMLFVKRDRIPLLNIPEVGLLDRSSVLKVVHPVTYRKKIRHLTTIRSSLRSLYSGLTRRITGMLREQA